MPPRNKNNYSKKEKRAQIMRITGAALLAVFVHLAFFGFKKADSGIQTTSIRPRQVMLLPDDTKIPSEQNLIAWLNIMNPTDVIKPDPTCGFHAHYAPIQLKDIPLTMNLNFSENSDTKPDFLPVPWQDMRTKVTNIWKYKSIGIEPLDISRFRKKLNYPAWLSEMNEELPQLFEHPDKVKAFVQQNPPPSGETVLKALFFGPNFFPKVEIAYSCGNKELDYLAARTLTVKGKKLAINDEDSHDPFFITVQWLPNR